MRIKHLLIILVLLIFICSIGFVNAEPYLEWAVSFDSNGNDFVTDIAVDASNNLIVTGFNGLFAPSYSDYLTIKYNADGIEQWSQTYDYGNIDWSYGVATDSQDNVIVSGVTNFYSLVIKYDPTGNEMWAQTYFLASTHDVVVDSQDNIIVAGWLFNGSKDNFFLMKYDSAGNEIWVKVYDSNYTNRFYALDVDSQDNIIVTGYSIIDGSSQYRLIKYDSEGDLLWTQTNVVCSPKGLVVDSENNLLLAGYFWNGENHDYCVTKYDENGNELWTNFFDGGYNDYANAIDVDLTGNIFVTGYTSFYDYLTIKYTPLGDELWKKTYSSGGNDRGQGIVIDHKGDIIVTGTSNNDLYTIKYVENNLEVPRLVNPSPLNNYYYKVCDNLTLAWIPGSNSDGTYYISAEHNLGLKVKDVKVNNTSILLPAKFIETNLPDGNWQWWVCNEPNNFECSEKRTLIKHTTPELLEPDNGVQIDVNQLFSWSSVANAKNYILKVIGPQFPPTHPHYKILGNNTLFILDSFAYNFLTPGVDYYWSATAVCNENPTYAELSKYSYSEQRSFYK